MGCHRGPRGQWGTDPTPPAPSTRGIVQTYGFTGEDVGARDNSGHDAGALRRADLGAVLDMTGVRAGRRLRRPGARVLDVRSVDGAAGPGPALAGRRLGRARPPLSLLLRGEDADEEPAAPLDGQALVPVWWTSNVGLDGVDRLLRRLALQRVGGKDDRRAFRGLRVEGRLEHRGKEARAAALEVDAGRREE